MPSMSFQDMPELQLGRGTMNSSPKIKGKPEKQKSFGFADEKPHVNGKRYV